MTKRPKGPEPPDYYSSGEVARMFGVTSRTVANWCDRGLLPYIETPAGHRRIPASAIKGGRAYDSRLAAFQKHMAERRGTTPVPTGEQIAETLRSGRRTGPTQQPKVTMMKSSAGWEPRTRDHPAGDPDAGNEKMATVTLWLRVENNSKFVRGKKRVRENIERFNLREFAAKKQRDNTYELRIPYRDEAHLDKRINDLIRDMAHEADLHNCFIEVDVREEATGRSW